MMTLTPLMLDHFNSRRNYIGYCVLIAKMRRDEYLARRNMDRLIVPFLFGPGAGL